ncbi:MAG: bacillithiol biosynthesis cysteine-adding enzyme BshC [Bacteroidia bacterium]|nr:bacillithiol biosynthesis cysteine-adding enzyme BshC [Bacteroidia bacterium]
MEGSFKSIAQNFLAKEIDLQEFVSEKQFLESKNQFDIFPKYSTGLRQKLVSTIRKQYGELELPKTLSVLEQADCYTVTTGHQLCLNGGPLFVLYKILHTIALANELTQKNPQKPVVPIFWMATEDHDIQEVNHFFLNYSQKVQYSQSENTGGVGDILFDPQEIPAEYQPFLHPKFQQKKHWKTNFRELIHHYFNSLGLIIIDANDRTLKQEIIPYLTDDLKNHSSFYFINETNSLLSKYGYPIQAFARKVNWFYLAENKRIRIEHNTDSFQAENFKSWNNIHNLLQEVQEYPENFSPNVLLRPVYQQVILPNLAYIGGWGEIAYWLQLKRLFSHWNVHFPILLPRFSGFLYTQAQRKSWEDSGLPFEDIFLPNAELRKKIAMKLYDNEQVKLNFNNLLLQAEQFSQGLVEQSLLADATQKSFLVTLNKHFTHWEKKFWKRLYPKNRQLFESLFDLKNQIQPDGFTQERTLNWVYLTTLYPDLIPKIQENIGLFDGKPIQIELLTSK